jgi:hypothetical protein
MKSSRRFFQKKNAKTAGARNDSAGAAGTGLTRCCRGAVRCRAPYDAGLLLREPLLRSRCNQFADFKLPRQSDPAPIKTEAAQEGRIPIPSDWVEGVACLHPDRPPDDVLVHVPYRGNGPALTAVLGGQVEVQFPSPPSSIEYIRTGKLRGLGVTSAMRSEALPDLPAIGEFVPGYEMSAWFGAAAPKGTPADVIDKINNEINAGLADPKLRARLADLGDTPLALSPAEFGKLIADETEKWGKVMRAANIKLD